MKKPIVGNNQNRRKLFNRNQIDRFNQGYLYKTFITPKLHYLRIIHKNYLYNESSTN